VVTSFTGAGGIVRGVGTYVALLRGINVGGKNVIRMADLRACFEGEGFSEVETYIQSGNVVFVSGEKRETLAPRIEEALSRSFDYAARVVVRSRRQLLSVVRRAPEGFGEEADAYRYDVAFLKAPLSAREVLPQVRLREGVDTAHGGPRVLYFSRLKKRASQSYLSKLVALPVYAQMTLRNWNTTMKLVRMTERG
jgi:uncharacterized protein (DUF1697 family)